ncbi:hypothetical protein QLX08_010194 [Tetragonisca angustula]|uniref:Uncharacterized protein n=1 Tax=Tetragonisca angustula TaxID=166442 RepID=A0AAW0ZDN1_9HYME
MPLQIYVRGTTHQHRQESEAASAKKPFPPYKFSPECPDTSYERGPLRVERRGRGPNLVPRARPTPATPLGGSTRPVRLLPNTNKTGRAPLEYLYTATETELARRLPEKRRLPDTGGRTRRTGTHSKQRSIFQISGPFPSPNKWIKEGRRIQSSTGSTRSLCGTWPLTQTCMSAILS